MLVLAAGYLQYNAGRADAKIYLKDEVSSLDMERAAMFETDPDALARSLNMIEPSN